MWPFKKENKKFMLLQSEKEGRPVWITVDGSLKNLAKKDETPWCLWLGIQIESQKGLPDEKEAKELNDFEDEIQNKLSKIGKIHFVLRTTWNGHRDLYFYLSKAKESHELLLGITNLPKPPKQFQYEISKDPNWQSVNWVFEQLDKQPKSDNPKDENSVTLFAFNSNEKLKSLAYRALNDAIEFMKKDGKFNPFCLTEKELWRPKSIGVNENIQEIEKHIGVLQDETIAVYCHSGTIGIPPFGKEVNWPTQFAIFVKAYDKNEDKGYLIFQMYRPRTEAEGFAILGNTTIAPTPNIFIHSCFHEGGLCK